MPRRWGVLLGAGLGVALAVMPTTSIAEQQHPSARVAPSVASQSGLELLAIEVLSPRLTSMTVFSPALERTAKVRVLTPEGFDATRDHLPVLWLLHGGFGSSADWTTAGDAEALTAGMPLIVVMPDAGTGGWYADWRRATAQGPERWESFHLDELRPFIESRYQTRTDRGGRAVAGLSMGGFGALEYASRHPDLFGFAASFSGAVDILHPGIAGVVTISPLAHEGFPGDIFGEYEVNETDWRAHNPVDLASNLRTVAVQLRTGNGQPGGPHGGGYDIQEIGVSEATYTLHHRLDELGIAHLYDDYGPGAHTFDYWRDDLRATLPGVLATFDAPPQPDPTTVDHVAFEPSFAAWGYNVVLNRPVLESARLSIHPGGFDLTATGAGTVTTPPQFEPGQTVHATVVEASVSRTIDLTAAADGRVSIPVDAGPASLVDEYPLARLAATPKRTVHVELWT